MKTGTVPITIKKKKNPAYKIYFVIKLKKVGLVLLRWKYVKTGY